MSVEFNPFLSYEDDSIDTKTKSMDEETIEETRSYVYYTKLSNNLYLPLNKIDIVTKLPSGLYSFYHIDGKGWSFQKNNVESDEVYELPITELSLIKRDISKFWNTEHKFKEYGLVHKRGILLYGKPGCGKSCAIQLITKDLIENHNGLIFKISNRDDLDIFIMNFNNILRVIEPNRKVVVIMEDIDGLFEEAKSTQTRLLNLLDGINQNSNIVYVATTNYPERLEERILNRPSRFDKRYEFALPNSEIRESYLINSLKQKDLENIDLNVWIEQTEGLTLSHLRELIVSVIILENDFEVEIETLKGMGATRPSSSSYRDGITGFKRPEITQKKVTIVGFSSNGHA